MATIRRIFFIACLALPLMAAANATTNVPLATGALIRDTARITFEWPKTVRMEASRKGDTLTVTFNRRANPDFANVLRDLYPYVMSAEQRPDGKTIVFKLNKPYEVRSFTNDTLTVVELLKVDPEARPASMRGTETAKLNHLSPAAGADEPAAEPIAEAQPETTAEDEAPKASQPGEPLVLPETTETTETVTESVTPDPVAPFPGTTGEMPEQAAMEVEGQEVDDGRIKIGVSAASDNAVLRFPFKDRVAMAAFTRAGALWIAWDKSIPPNLSDFDELPRTVVGKAEIVPSENATVIRMPVDDAVHVSVAKEQNSFDWAVLVTPGRRDLITTLALQVNTDPPVAPHVFIPCLETADPVTVTDPQVGDKLVITPFFSVSEGMPMTRSFVQFSVLKTAQGLAVVKKADDTQVVPLRNGIRVLVEGGAVLTPGLQGIDKTTEAVGASQESATLFPYEFWKPGDEPEKQRLALFHRIVESEKVQDANEARLRMAQIYLSQGMAAEAIAFLDGIQRTNPAYYRSAKLAALRGAAHFLMYRFVDAQRDFAAAELNNNREVDYWRSMLADLLGNSDQNYDFLSINPDYVSKYPPTLRQRLAIVAADRSVSSKDYNTALKIFDTLNEEGLIDSINPYVRFLMAKISLEGGQEKEAMEAWDELAMDYEHPFVQARAEFSRILWGMDKNALSRDEAIDRLERLRLAWHGDSLELNILTMLGELYADKRDYVNAMRIWHGGVQAFPNTSSALDMARKMQEAFIIMFNEGLSESLPPLEALALYYEYRQYTPTGNTGNAIINRLADRLVSVDLLDQAAVLLDHQMRFQSEKEKRSETGVRLATVYLLNHKPDKALQALQDSVYGDNPLMLRLLRNRLTAEAMIELGQLERAMETLGQDTSMDAERLRIEIYWHEKDWEKLTAGIENLLKARKDVTAPVTVQESEYLMRLALAYTFQRNQVQLQYLNDYFVPLMQDNPNLEMFQFITGGDMPLTTTNFDAVLKKINDTRTFINNYSARVDTVDGNG